MCALTVPDSVFDLFLLLCHTRQKSASASLTTINIIKGIFFSSVVCICV